MYVDRGSRDDPQRGTGLEEILSVERHIPNLLLNGAVVASGLLPATERILRPWL